MKILCGLSGIEFTCEHFPGSFYAREVFHPVFNLPQKKLLSYTGKWAQGGLTTDDSYLLFLAILRSSDLVDFRVPAYRGENTDSIVALNMEALVRSVIKLNTVTNPDEVFPRCAITPETKDLSNVHDWINDWNSEYRNFRDGYISAHDSAEERCKLTARENALARMIKNPHKPLKEYANQVADWASVAGRFPEFLLQSPITKLNVTCAEYWKQIITRCAKNEYIFSFPKKDLIELIEHCEENIPMGSIYSSMLFKLLRRAMEQQTNFLGLGDMDLTNTSYRILENTDSKDAAQMLAIIDSAPEEEPTAAKYPGKLAFMRAKMRWEMAQKSKKASSIDSSIESSNSVDNPYDQSEGAL